MNTLSHLVLLSGGFLSLFALGEFLKGCCKIKVEYTRKFVHVGTGLLSLTFPGIFDSHWLVLLLCASFFCVLSISKKKKYLGSINAVSRKTYGALLFPVSVYACFLVQSLTADLLYYYLPLLILTISDPLAALVGQRFPYGKYKVLGHEKTLVGSLGFCLSAFGIASVFGMGYHSCVLIATLAAIVEAVSKDGFDNLSIPGSVLIVLTILENLDIC